MMRHTGGHAWLRFERVFAGCAIGLWLACCMPLQAQAAQANISLTFTGSYQSVTCAVTGAADQQVDLPTVSTAGLAIAGRTLGSTPFKIQVKCGSGVKSVRTFFESGTNGDAATGNLKNATTTGSAANVQIQLLNEDSTAIVVGKAASATSVTPDAGGLATLNYQAQYYATGKTTAGPVNTSVTYVIDIP
jgi:major type 1 subunit fimbrin (pilin)